MKDSRRCTATANSTGERCKNAAILGSNVCRVHGGSAPQVQKKAQDRLDEMADKTTADIQRNIEDLQGEYERIDDPEATLAIMSEMRRLWKIVLDRTGHGPTEKRELSGSVDSEQTVSLDAETAAAVREAALGTDE